MDPLIGRLLAGSPELRDDWDREVATAARRGKGGDMTEAAALAWATLAALQAGRDCQKLFVDLDEILRDAPVEDWLLIDVYLEDLMMAMNNAEFEDLLTRIGPVTRREIDEILAPVGALMRVAPNMPDLISHIGPATIASDAPGQIQPGSGVEIVGIKIGQDGTHGEGIGPSGRYEVKFANGSTADVEERFVNRPPKSTK